MTTQNQKPAFKFLSADVIAQMKAEHESRLLPVHGKGDRLDFEGRQRGEEDQRKGGSSLA